MKYKSLPYAGIIRFKFNGFSISAKEAPREIDNDLYIKIYLNLLK